MAVYIGDKKEMVLFLEDPKVKPWGARLVCMGRKRHYRKDGSCKHVAAVLERLKPWYRARTKLDRFGGVE